MTERLARYAAFADHHSANEWLALGWMPHPALEGCYHGQFAVLVVWICDCPKRKPQRFCYAKKTSEHRRLQPLIDKEQEETQRDYDEEGLYGWGIDRRAGL